MFNIEHVAKHFGKGSLLVIILTFILFTIALYVKGLTHDLLLEVAVFLISVKLILMTYSNSITSKRLEKKLIDIDNKIEQLLAAEHNKSTKGK